MKEERKYLVKMLGGSHLYGLNTPDSDEDLRGVYLSMDRKHHYGFTDDSKLVSVTDDLDFTYFELTTFFHLLKKTNTNTMEILMASPETFLSVDPLFMEIVKHKYSFVDSQRLLKSVKGYLLNESRLALGERAGKMGGKRRKQLDKYGFSPKNVSHMVRLGYTTKHFFETGEYLPNFTEANPEVFHMCLELKTKPELYTVEDIKTICKSVEGMVCGLEDTVGSEFDCDLACELINTTHKTYL